MPGGDGLVVILERLAEMAVAEAPIHVDDLDEPGGRDLPQRVGEAAAPGEFAQADICRPVLDAASTAGTPVSPATQASNASRRFSNGKAA